MSKCISGAHTLLAGTACPTCASCWRHKCAENQLLALDRACFSPETNHACLDYSWSRNTSVETLGSKTSRQVASISLRGRLDCVVFLSSKWLFATIRTGPIRRSDPWEERVVVVRGDRGGHAARPAFRRQSGICPWPQCRYWGTRFGMPEGSGHCHACSLKQPLKGTPCMLVLPARAWWEAAAAL